MLLNQSSFVFLAFRWSFFDLKQWVVCPKSFFQKEREVKGWGGDAREWGERGGAGGIGKGRREGERGRGRLFQSACSTQNLA